MPTSCTQRLSPPAHKHSGCPQVPKPVPVPGPVQLSQPTAVFPQHQAFFSHVLGVSARQPSPVIQATLGSLSPCHHTPSGLSPTSRHRLVSLTTVFYLSHSPDPHWIERATRACPLHPGPWWAPDTLSVNKGGTSR